MTPTEILSEIQKMPLVEKHKVFIALTEQLKQTRQADLTAQEKKMSVVCGRKAWSRKFRCAFLMTNSAETLSASK